MQSKEDIKKEKILSVFDNDYKLLSENGLKAKALKFYKKNNFPGLKDEGWRQTNLTPIFSNEYIELNVDEEIIDINNFNIPGLEANKLVFINGFYSLKHSRIISEGLQIGSIKTLSKEMPDVFKKHFESTEIHSENNFTAINTAYAHDGTFVYVNKNQVIDKPVHIFNITTTDKSILAQTRNLVITEIGSGLEIIETYHSLGGESAFTNVVTEVIAGMNSSIKWTRIQDESQNSNHMNHMKVVQYSDSNFMCNTITLSGGLVRNNIAVKLANEGCNSNLFGLYLVKGKQLVDNYTFIDHAMPRCESNQVYKGIINDEASAVFFGRVLVAKDAQKTNANQTNRNVLLSENAKINSKPQLEIYADDVACSHGSTTGQLDQDAMFYLQSRGIPKNKAQAMLLYGFVSEVIDELPNEEIKDYIDVSIKKILGEE